MAPAGDTPPVDEETARVRTLYDAMEPRYDRIFAVGEHALFGDGRRWACTSASGQVLEVAVGTGTGTGTGTGRNLPYYPPGARLTAIDLSPAMLAGARAAAVNRPVELRLGDAQHLDFPDATFDTVLATLPCAASPTTTPPSLKWRAYCAPVAT